MECPDIVIEEDYLSKPSPAKKANLSSGNNVDLSAKKTRTGGGGHGGSGGPGGGGVEGGKEGGNKGSDSGAGGAVTNGIEMESDEEESDDLFPPVPLPQVAALLPVFAIWLFFTRPAGRFFGQLKKIPTKNYTHSHFLMETVLDHLNTILNLIGHSLHNSNPFGHFHRLFLCDPLVQFRTS